MCIRDSQSAVGGNPIQKASNHRVLLQWESPWHGIQGCGRPIEFGRADNIWRYYKAVCNADDLPRSFRPCQKRSGEGSFFGKEHQEGARGAGSGPQGWQEGREGKPLRSRVRGSAGHGCPAEPSRSSDDRRCPRDIFPIPPTHVSEFVYGCKSRKTQQRRGRRRFFEAEVNRTIDSLNQMYGRPGLQHCGGLDLENYGNLSI